MPMLMVLSQELVPIEQETSSNSGRVEGVTST